MKGRLKPKLKEINVQRVLQQYLGSLDCKLQSDDNSFFVPVLYFFICLNLKMERQFWSKKLFLN
jgi:hypothetical protein